MRFLSRYNTDATDHSPKGMWIVAFLFLLIIGSLILAWYLPGSALFAETATPSGGGGSW